MSEGILLVNKPAGITSFTLVKQARRLTKIKKVGHAGTLDPFATGVMVLLLGRNYTQKSNDFLQADKEYVATIHLGQTTDTYDIDGQVTATSDLIPSDDDVLAAVKQFQGTIEQIPPMYSAKKINGRKLYELAREGKEIERKPAVVTLQISDIAYHYPYLEVRVRCSKGTYIRSLAYDIGTVLGCGAHLKTLERTRSGGFSIEECLDGELLNQKELDLTPYLRR